MSPLNFSHHSLFRHHIRLPYIVAMVFSPRVNISTLNGQNGFNLSGKYAAITSVRDAGDINGDGIDDLVLGAKRANPDRPSNFYDTSRVEAGETYVIFGRENGFAKNINLTNLNGRNGFVLKGINVYDESGSSVSGAGDINGDGIDDLIIGAPNGDATGQKFAGESYVIFGTRAGFDKSVELSDINGRNGFILDGEGAFDTAGSAVSRAGDFNGDGIDDLIIRAAGNRSFAEDKSYLVFGSKTRTNARLSLADLDGKNGFEIVGTGGDAFRDAGRSVSEAGDVNGDGFDDIIIGTFEADKTRRNTYASAGRSYIVFGSAANRGKPFDLRRLNGRNGFAASDREANANSGFSVGSAGDFNGDGFDDVLIGAPGSRYSFSTNNQQNRVYLIFGSRAGFPRDIDLSNLTPRQGIIIEGIESIDRAGAAVSGAGDVNGDGFDDILIGAPEAKGVAETVGEYSPFRRSGDSYVVFGRQETQDGLIFLNNLKGFDGFAVDASSNLIISSAGDINNDGLSDVAFGNEVIFGIKDTNRAPEAKDDTFITGKGSLLLGNVFADNGSGTDADVDGDKFFLAAINDNIFNFNGRSPLGISHQLTLDSGALLTFNDRGTFRYDPNGQFNRLTGSRVATDTFTYTLDDGNGKQDTAQVSITINADKPAVIVGTNGKDNLLGTEQNDLIRGRLGSDRLNGGKGNDRLDGSLGNDFLRGGDSNDILTGDLDEDKLFGGNGIDLLQGGKGNDKLNGDDGNDFLKGDKGDDRLVGGRGNDELDGGQGNDILVGAQGDDILSGGFGNDSLIGGAGDDTLNGGVGDNRLNGGAGSDIFVLEAGQGLNTILGFERSDRILLGSGLSIRGLSFVGSDIIRKFDNQIIATLPGVRTANLNNTQFLTA